MPRVVETFRGGPAPKQAGKAGKAGRYAGRQARQAGGQARPAGAEGWQAPKAGRHPRQAGTRGIQASEAGRQAPKAGKGRQAGTQGRQAGTRARTPAHPESRTDTHTYARTLGFKLLTFEINSSKLKFLTRRRKIHGLRKTNSDRTKCSTSDKELHNLIRGTCGVNFGISKSNVATTRQRTTQPHSWHIGWHQETPKSMHASGTSGPLSHVATEARTGVRQELLDKLLHVTTKPSS